MFLRFNRHRQRHKIFDCNYSTYEPCNIYSQWQSYALYFWAILLCPCRRLSNANNFECADRCYREKHRQESPKANCCNLAAALTRCARRIANFEYFCMLEQPNIQVFITLFLSDCTFLSGLPFTFSIFFWGEGCCGNFGLLEVGVEGDWKSPSMWCPFLVPFPPTFLCIFNYKRYKLHKYYRPEFSVVWHSPYPWYFYLIGTCCKNANLF